MVARIIRQLPRIKALLAGALAGLCLAPGAVVAEVDVRLELVLAVDCSSSVDAAEFALQMEGIAAAFEDPGVLAALEQAGDAGIAVSLLQWSGSRDQVRAIDWTHLTSPADAQAFADRLRGVGRLVQGGATSLAHAIDASVVWTRDNGFRGERVVIDVSGDGRANIGDPPATARAAANRAGVTINGLAILNEEPWLAGYYIAGVVGGPGAFLMTARDFEAFAAAMRRKLYFEILGPPVASAGGTP
jgi:Protein of unknown function (DUF1194)